MNEIKQTNYYEIVGVIGDEIYMLDYSFDDGQDFKGCTGTTFKLVSKEEYGERTDAENIAEEYRDVWVETVKSNRTDDSLIDWVKQCIEEDENFVFDMSYAEYHDKIREVLGVTEEDYPMIECVGGGRCFSKNMKFDKVFNQKLVDVINEFEEEAKDGNNNN